MMKFTFEKKTTKRSTYEVKNELNKEVAKIAERYKKNRSEYVRLWDKMEESIETGKKKWIGNMVQRLIEKLEEHFERGVISEAAVMHGDTLYAKEYVYATLMGRIYEIDHEEELNAALNQMTEDGNYAAVVEEAVVTVVKTIIDKSIENNEDASAELCDYFERVFKRRFGCVILRYIDDEVKKRKEEMGA